MRILYLLSQELSDQVLNEHFNSVLHIVTDSVLSMNDFRQLLQNVTNSSDPASLQAIEYQLIIDQKITKSVCKETNEVRERERDRDRERETDREREREREKERERETEYF